jgi:hypothetical protein
MSSPEHGEFIGPGEQHAAHRNGHVTFSLLPTPWQIGNA